MRAHTLNRRVGSGDLGDDRVVIVRVEQAAVANLATRLGVERRVVEDHLAFVTGLQLLHAPAVFDDGEDGAIFGARAAVAFEVGFRELLVGWVRGLLRCAFPGGFGALPLLIHCEFEALLGELQASISNSILYEVERKPKGIVEPKGLEAGIRDQRFRISFLGFGEGFQLLFELLEADFHGVGEAFLFRQYCLGHSLGGFIEFRIRIPHQVANREDHFVQERFGLA